MLDGTGRGQEEEVRVAVPSPAANQDAVYDSLSYMSSPAISGDDVTLGKTGYNPYRTRLDLFASR